MASKDMEAHVTVIETSTGKKLTGEDAPIRKDLEKWLSEHPGSVIHVAFVCVRIYLLTYRVCVWCIVQTVYTCAAVLAVVYTHFFMV